MNLIDLHMHTFFSDGVLSPAELVYRCSLKGLSALALTDHVDYSNMEHVIGGALRSSYELSRRYNIKVIAGVELTYVPPDDIKNMVGRARELGAALVVVHGETVAESVPPGTNIEAVRAGCDILAHPGILTPQQAEEAAKRNVYIELTTRRGHRDANPRVAREALKKGCRLIVNTDTHSPGDILDQEKAYNVMRQCGLDKDSYVTMLNNSAGMVEKIWRQ